MAAAPKVVPHVGERGERRRRIYGRIARNGSVGGVGAHEGEGDRFFRVGAAVRAAAAVKRKESTARGVARTHARPSAIRADGRTSGGGLGRIPATGVCASMADRQWTRAAAGSGARAVTASFAGPVRLVAPRPSRATSLGPLIARSSAVRSASFVRTFTPRSVSFVVVFVVVSCGLLLYCFF